jgi:hypothetical protein
MTIYGHIAWLVETTIKTKIETRLPTTALPQKSHQTGSLPIIIEPLAANMPPTPWATEIHAPSI